MKSAALIVALALAALAAGPAAANDPQQRQKSSQTQTSAPQGQRLYGDNPMEDRLVLRLANEMYVGKDFRIEVENGTANIRGTVPSEDDRDRIIDIARSTPGVTNVNAHMQIVPATKDRGPGIADDRLAEQVASRAAAMIPGAKAERDGIKAPDDEAQITVQADNGDVTLDGDVARPATVLTAVEAALQVEGVHSVRSRIDAREQTAGTMRRDDAQPSAVRRGSTEAQKRADTFRGEHVMRGEVTKIDAEKGLVAVKSQEGPTLDLHFPPSALRDVRKGDAVAIELGIRPDAGDAASPATERNGNRPQKPSR